MRVSAFFEIFARLATSIALWSFALIVWDVTRISSIRRRERKGLKWFAFSGLAAVAGSILLFSTLPGAGALEAVFCAGTILSALAVDALVGDTMRNALGLNA